MSVVRCPLSAVRCAVSQLIQRIHSHRYTASSVVTVFSAQQQHNEASMDSYAAFLHCLCPTSTDAHYAVSATPCTIGEYVDLLSSYAAMYDTVHQTSVLLLGALLAECGRVLTAASSMSATAAAVQWKYMLVWRSGCGRDSEREQRLEQRWKEDRDRRKAESSKTAERKSVGSVIGSSGARDSAKGDNSNRKSRHKS